jgi:uncharacterized protein YjbI with pentapeptide repeats
MQVVKPQALCLTTRPIEYRKRFGLCVTAMLHVPFAQAAGGTLWGEQSAWNFIGREMAVPLVDEGVAKLTSEFLVHGKAFAPKDARGACAVRARVGSRSKSLLVFGDRRWEGVNATAPAAFDEMPIEWARAWGGPPEPGNPDGVGAAPQDGVHRLPNIELPGDPLRHPEQRVAPAGFGARGPMHPERARYRGTYDADYLKMHAPGFAPDLDWRYFNLAPADQWFDAPLRGDEPFAFDHMHPQKASVEGRLPGLRARVFADYRAAGATAPRLREVPLRLTTAWFFPHAERALLLFQGLAEVARDDGGDVHGLLGAVERLDAPRPDHHYLDALARRADPRWGGIECLDDSDLLPEGLDAVDPEAERAAEAFASQGLQAEAQRRRAEVDVALAREDLRASGRDPDALGVVMPPRERLPTPAQRVPYLKKKIVEAEQQQLAAIDDVLDALERAAASSKAHKAMKPLPHRGPPTFNADVALERLQAANAGATGTFDLSATRAKLLQQEAMERVGYLQGAHEQSPAPAMAPAQAGTLRDGLKQALAGGLRFFSGMDFTGADLSGLDLRGVNFAGAWLESADLTKANLSGANLTSAVLAHARLDGAIGIGTVLRGANLGRTRWQGAVFDEADFSDTQLSQADLGGLALRRARIKGAMLIGTRWEGADAHGLQAQEQLFYRLALPGLRLGEAGLAGCQFVECDLTGADFREANLAQANLVTCQLEGARFGGATGGGMVFAQHCFLADADFSGARMQGVNFGGSDMSRARLVGSVVDGANFCEALLPDSDWRMASAKGALLRRTALQGARLAGVNFSDAILQHADLRGADLRNSNLFGADLSRARLDAGVRFEGALLKRARTWPRLTPEQHAAGA